MNSVPDNKSLLLRLEHVGVCYDSKPVLSDVCLDVRQGDFIAVSGPNGGGKTTLLRVMLKLLRPSSGRVEYWHDGGRVNRLAIGYLPQKNNIDLKFPMSVEQTVRSGILTGFFGRYPADAEQKLRQVVELTGISDYLSRPVGNLSGGQLQRTLMARALVSDPELLVLDEPLSYVDKQFEHQIYDIVRDLSRRITIILVSHELSVISRMANRHIIVDHTLRECHSHVHWRPSGCE